MKLTLSIVNAFFLLLNFALTAQAVEPALNLQEPALVVQRYLRAVYARDYIEAYRYLSSEDRRVKDLNRYVHQKGAYQGFSLEAMKKLAEFAGIRSVFKGSSPNHLEVTVQLKTPDLGKVSGLLLDWNTYQLNSLPAVERQKIIESIERKNRDGSLIMNNSEEKLELIKEGNEWRIFLAWAAGIKIALRTLSAAMPDLEVGLSKNQVVVQPGDVFEVFLKIKNRFSRPIMARIAHLIEPEAVADYLDFAECGFLLPITLQPGEQEYSGRYVVSWSIPEGVHQLSLTYEFKPLK